MSALDDRLRDTAARLLLKAGRMVTVLRATDRRYDPSTGQAEATTTSTEVPAVIEDAKVGRDGSLAHFGDLDMTVAARTLPDAPKPGDTVQIDDETYAVLAVSTSWAGATPVLYRLQIRR